ncbi:hypothetical protein Q5741_04495 [Paenibacillus sp. JX-17]|uniref:DUF3918 domain-containing protein n=1 Tax=Paenibacillus lacisoli TaxID=3064525 RepID=A0ABT9C8U3_9BACL|nr:hypothetical protein [Paenibacillus sp. JX-17]MDO7905670.1 hypothetical protein [Paenibacillus sp. JX-17]
MDKKKVLFAALGLGATYLMKNKDARQKVMNSVGSFTKNLSSKQAAK